MAVIEGGIKNWVEQQISEKRPLMSIRRELLDKQGETDNENELTRLRDAANEIEHTMVLRNLKGVEYEELGKEAAAVKLYEANVRDQFEGIHPYERLRVIYDRDGRHEEILRICRSFISHGKNEGLKDRYEKLIEELTARV